MNNRRGLMKSLVAVGVTGAAIYGVTKGVQNGTFGQLTQKVTNAFGNGQNDQTENQYS